MTSPDEDYAARRYYTGDVARGYAAHRTATPAAAAKWEAERAAIVELLDGATAGGRALDLPCGDGRFAALLESVGLRVIGVDVSGDMLRVGRERGAFGAGTVGLIEADGTRLPLPPASVDVVLTARFLNLVPLAVVDRVLREIRRVVTGTAVVEVRLTDRPTVQRLVAAARRGVDRVRRPRVEAAATTRDPLRVHTSHDFERAVVAAGLRVVHRVEVQRSRWPHTTRLWMLRLEPAP
jgi:SAM-dependent methyltransferase